MFRRLAQGDTQSVLDNLVRTNPSFAQFMRQNQGKSIEQGFREYGYDLNEILSALNQTR
jgi:hypothetical protein